jgi:radical SAM protein with 4Fe4S-binding SPASM domain
MEYLKYFAFSTFTPSFPQVIQIQTKYGCNARCVFCPMGREQNQLHGQMDDVTFQWRYATWCTIPFWRAWILWNGDVVLCCVDWERRHVFGSIHESSIREIWNNEGYRKYRDRMRKNDFAGTLCEGCKGV